MKPSNNIDRRAGRRTGVRTLILVGAICCVALLISLAFTRLKTASATRSSTLSPSTPVYTGTFVPNSSIAVSTTSAFFVIHLPPRFYVAEASGTLREMSSAEMFRGRSLDLIDLRYQPESDLRR